MADWCEGSGKLVAESLAVYGAGFEAADVQCPECELRLSTTMKFASGEWITPDHAVPEAPSYPKVAVPKGRAGAIWNEFQDVQAWTRTQQGYTDEARNLAARIIVGVNSIPELSLLAVIENAQRARNAFIFRQSVAGLLPDSIPSSERRKYSGSWDIVWTYYKAVASGDATR